MVIILCTLLDYVNKKYGEITPSVASELMVERKDTLVNSGLKIMNIIFFFNCLLARPSLTWI